MFEALLDTAAGGGGSLLGTDEDRDRDAGLQASEATDVARHTCAAVLATCLPLSSLAIAAMTFTIFCLCEQVAYLKVEILRNCRCFNSTFAAGKSNSSAAKCRCCHSIQHNLPFSDTPPIPAHKSSSSRIAIFPMRL